MTPFFSIIVPIYKVESYLTQCIESVLNQSYKNFELILVDDGSPDKCPEICDSFSFLDKRVKVIHKVNGGQSDARNVGLKNAKGEYIIFLDSDDYWDDKNALLFIYESISQYPSDIVLFGCKDFFIEKKDVRISRNGYDIDFLKNHNIDKNVLYLFKENLFPGAAWLLAVKRDILLDKKIFFKKGIKAEDYDWLIHLFLSIETINAVNEPFYVYRYGRQGSTTKTSDLSSINSIMSIIDYWYPILIKMNTLSSRCFLGYLSYIYMTSLVIFTNICDKDKSVAYDLIYKRKNIIKCAYTKKQVFLSFLYRILGLNGMIFVIKLLR